MGIGGGEDEKKKEGGRHGGEYLSTGACLSPVHVTIDGATKFKGIRCKFYQGAGVEKIFFSLSSDLSNSILNHM
jgi:hypothetical protein